MAAWPDDMGDEMEWGRRVLESLEADVTSVAGDVKDVRRMLLGNGKRGLYTRLELIEQAVESLRGRVDSLESATNTGETPDVTKARLRLASEIVIAASAVLALVLHLTGG